MHSLLLMLLLVALPSEASALPPQGSHDPAAFETVVKPFFSKN